MPDRYRHRDRVRRERRRAALRAAAPRQAREPRPTAGPGRAHWERADRAGARQALPAADPGRLAAPTEVRIAHLHLLAAPAVLSPVARQRGAPAPVVVELFTSQAAPPARRRTRCSPSSPGPRGDRAGAARRLLGLPRLERHSRSAEHTERQRAYAKAAKSRSIYTPQMVVQGVGAAEGARRRAHPREDRRAPDARAPWADARARRRSAARRVEPRDDGVGAADVHVVRFVPSRRWWRSRAARTPAGP